MNPRLLELFTYMWENSGVDLLFRGQLFLAADAASIEGQARQKTHPRSTRNAHEMLESTAAGTREHVHLVGGLQRPNDSHCTEPQDARSNA